MTTIDKPCYSDHNHDIATKGACDMCGGGPLGDGKGVMPDPEPPVEGAVSQRYAVAKRVVTGGQFENLEGQLLDLQTANVMVIVYEALSDANKAKFDSIPLMRLVEFCWKNTTGGSK